MASSFEITDGLRPCLQDIAGCEITVSADHHVQLPVVDGDGGGRGAGELRADGGAHGGGPCLQDIAGCEITVSASSSMGMVSGEDINVEITGNL